MQIDGGSTVTAQVVTLPWRRVWRGPIDAIRDRRAVRRLAGARFGRAGITCSGGTTHDLGNNLTVRRQMVLVEWESPERAEAGAAELEQRFAARGADVWTAFLTPVRAHGTWKGQEAFRPAGEAPTAPISAVLSYGRVRPRWIYEWYYRALPKVHHDAKQPGSGMAAGIGFVDIPVRHACTLSFWSSGADIARYAYGRSAAHGDVQKRSVEQRWFDESLFARFAVTGHRGSWAGTDPLAAASLR